MQQVKSGTIERGQTASGPKSKYAVSRVSPSASLATNTPAGMSRLFRNWKRHRFCFGATTSSHAMRNVGSRLLRKTNLSGLNPLAIDPAHPFPQTRQQGTVYPGLHRRCRTQQIRTAHGDYPRCRVSCLESCASGFDVAEIPRSTSSSVILSNAMSNNCFRVCVHSAVPFRITRNSDLYFDEEEVENLLNKLEEELMNREKGAAVRLEIASEQTPC